MGSRRAIGMVGGGPGSVIGPIHRIASGIAGFDLRAGVFSSDHGRSLTAADAYSVEPGRCYATTSEMLATEAGRPDGIEAVVVATPNHLHADAALETVAAGLALVIDKPLAATLEDARAIEKALVGSDGLCAVTYTYTGFPMVREARARVAQGRIGSVRKVVCAYSQGWLARPVERCGSPQASWRTDPARSGAGGSSADVGVHAFNLIEYVVGRRVVAMIADARPLVKGRRLDDDCNALLRLEDGGSGVLISSQVAWGERNALSIDVYGDAGALHWSFDRADELVVVDAELCREVVGGGSPGLSIAPPDFAGFGGGVIAPLSAIYSDVLRAMDGDGTLLGAIVPGIVDGVRGVAFFEGAARSDGTAWIPLV